MLLATIVTLFTACTSEKRGAPATNELDSSAVKAEEIAKSEAGPEAKPEAQAMAETQPAGEPGQTSGNDNATATAPAKTVPASASGLRKGANLVETLKQFDNITWDYNADYGVTANVGEYWITIPEDDLTPEGQEIIHSILSDMVNDIKFSVKYIKPSAKVGEFEHN